MKEFRLLKANEIEVRKNFGKDSNNYLLYIDSRSVTKLLDETVGAMNWQTEFYEVNGQTFGKLGIWDDEKKQWVWKSDVGSETNIEARKGEVSDCYKRLLCRWGVTELYSSPKITIDNPNQYAKYKVSQITYNEDREIETLSIVDNYGNVVFNWHNGQQQQQPQTHQTSTAQPATEQPKTYQLRKLNNPIEANGMLNKSLYRDIMFSQTTDRLKSIYELYPELHENKYFVDTLKKKKAALTA